MDRHVMLDNIELVLLTFDEVVDGGYGVRSWRTCFGLCVSRCLNWIHCSLQDHLGG
jgi:hypothetical protein